MSVYDPKPTTASCLAYESKSSQSKTNGVCPVHHSKGREILNAVGCKLGGSVIVVNSKKGKGHTLKLNGASAGLSPDHALDGSRATEADASQDPAPAEFSRLVVGEVPSASQEL
jgi:hypothetical protein